MFSKGAMDLNSAKVSSGKGVYLEEGTHELEVADWKAIETRKKGDAFIIDFKVINSTTHEPGTIRNVYIAANNDMAPQKIKAILIALAGYHLTADAEKIAGEDWNKRFAASLAKPALMIGRRVLCNATKQLKAEPKKELMAKPGLAEDPEWRAKAYYLDMQFSPYQKPANDNAVA